MNYTRVTVWPNKSTVYYRQGDDGPFHVKVWRPSMRVVLYRMDTNIAVAVEEVRAGAEMSDELTAVDYLFENSNKMVASSEAGR